MKVASQHTNKTPTKLLRRLVGVQLLVTAGLFAIPGQAAEEPDFLLSTDTFRYDSQDSYQDSYYETRGYSRNFNTRGLEVYEGVYVGQLRIAEKDSPGVFVDKEGYFLGLNQRGVEFLIKF
jgi:hypothetical protein